MMMCQKANKWFCVENDHLPPLQTLSSIAFIILVCSFPTFAFTSGVGKYINECAGLLWHLSMYFFISKLPTPEWGRKAGTCWVLLDVLCGILYINNFYGITSDTGLGIMTATGFTLPMAIRLAAHVFEGIWLVSSARTTDNKAIKVCGICSGLLIAGYSIVSPFAPAWALSLNMPFMIIWFALIVMGKYKKSEQ